MDDGEDEPEALKGRMGRVTVPIPAGRPGEIVVSIRGGTERYAAYCDVPVAKHSPVVIVDERSARTVDVTPFPEADGL
ncbi:MAG TPA: hypothetical protein VG435_06855 [Acidimicrobiales bacterium]|jgi:hypothetical protein|nr:hypothetical protein [Acidimicrobiales bacterium]